MFATARPGGMVTTENEPFTTTRDTGRSAAVIAASPQLFDTVGVTIRRGRSFTERDDAAAPRVAVVSERLARAVFQSVDVVGRKIVVGARPRLSPRAPETMTVVGVSADLDEPTRSYRGRIFRLVLFDGMRRGAKGIVLGLAIGVGARLAVRSWVVTDISAFEPLVLTVVPIPFVVAALVACYLPAARASRVDPNVALRDL